MASRQNDPPKRRIACFVASAFDQVDVDAIYDDAIRPTLRGLNIVVRRVDRLEHNDDIDERIMQLMLASDFCIADLTYARPSVYYEAGFITGRGKQVIFIARSDHFRARDNDPQGNLKVHFDLQMKNIIGWKTPDRRFRNRLAKRVSFVLRQLGREERQKQLRARRDAATNRHETAFAALSIADQIGAVEQAAMPLLRRRGFAHVHSSPRFGEVVKRSHHAGIDLLSFRAIPRLAAGLNDGTFIMYNVLRSGGIHENDQFSWLRSLLIFAPLSSFQTHALSHAFPTFTPLRPTLLKNQGTMERHEPNGEFGRRFRGARKSVPWLKYVAVLPPVKSIPEFKQSLTDLLSEIADTTLSQLPRRANSATKRA